MTPADEDDRRIDAPDGPTQQLPVQQAHVQRAPGEAHDPDGFEALLQPDYQPSSRREARERAERHAAAAGLAWDHSETPLKGTRDPASPPPRRHRRAWTAVIITVVILALLGGGGVYAWNVFQPQVQQVLQIVHPASTDYTGDGTGAVDVTIKDGDIGSDIADMLAKSGVTKTSDAFYKLLLQTVPAPEFQPGVYQLKKHMSAKSALALLQDPKSKLTRTLTIPEGQSEATILANAAKTTGIPLSDLQAAAASPAAFGLPAQATTLEGFLFPATYSFDPGVTAQQVITMMVDRAKQAFQQDGVPADSLWQTVILASIVQKEAGPNPDDLGKIARVFDNRLAQGMLLQSDATVAYGTGHTDTVWTTDAERNDASNPYNTYVHPGLPVGPIGNPGDAALQAALNPTPGSWLYFTVVNLQTGETAFSDTEKDHETAVAQLQAWCKASPDNAKYCQ